MPTYEYECLKCHHHFDIRHGCDEKPELSCPECKSAVKKVFTTSGIIFKGSGWYITDNASKPAPATAPAPATPAPVAAASAPTPATTEK